MSGTKYRPLDFSSVLGLDSIKLILQRIIHRQEFDSAYLFSGDFSTGKTTLGRILVRSVFCTNRKEDMSPCNECSSCRDFLSERHPGYIEVDAANNGSKDKIKEIREKLSYESVMNRIFILFDECHNISKEGNDALLKEIEKDRENVHFIFCTTELDKMPPPLRSRCIQFNINQPTEDNIQKKLAFICQREKLDYEPEALKLIVLSTGRHYRDAENKLRQVSFLGGITVENTKKVVCIYEEEIARMLVFLSDDIGAAMEICDFIAERMNIKNIYETIIRLLIDAIKLHQGDLDVESAAISYLSDIERQYGDSLYEVLDFILSKGRFTDLTFLQSDLLLMHYKFIRCQFDPKSTPEVKTLSTNQSNSEKIKSRNKMEDLKKAGSSWERAELMRKIRNEKKKSKKDERVEENVSKEWGPEVDKFGTDSVFKKEVSPTDFMRTIGGALDDDKI
jgi:DNA polymerase III subunit gamma/tau